MIQIFQKCKNFQKNPIGSGCNSCHKYAFINTAQKSHHPVLPQRTKKSVYDISVKWGNFYVEINFKSSILSNVDKKNDKKFVNKSW